MIAKADSPEFTAQRCECQTMIEIPFKEIESTVRAIVVNAFTTLIFSLPFIGLFAGWAVNIFRWVTGI